MTEHLLEHYRAGKVFAGGLKVRTTLDPELQDAAERAIVGRLAGVGPDAALVAIENDTGEVRAMVGGSDFNTRPFNLATNGHRQPGSAIKPFILARALDDGVDPNSVWASQPVSLPVRERARPEGQVRRVQLRRRLLRVLVALVRHRALGQLGVRPGRHEGRDGSGSRGSPSAWASARSSPPTRRCCSAA